ncbi:hypothetical protein AcW1_003687 [Taiwanofungus camphoratus]|nr:hypothetical protein AcW1_003687 [Antrodia cinnamomea]
MATSIIRRKPLHTYKSPSALAPADHVMQDLDPKARDDPPQADARSQSHTSSTRESSVIEPYVSSALSRKFHKEPLLPLYHPLGPLALSLPKLDPAAFGLPNSITVDDGEQMNDAARRSSSRARRPAAKVRDRERDGADEEVASQNTTTNARAPERETASRERTGSPRKRRAGGGGSSSGSGSKRKRKEPDDVDGVYPPPPKRTRNPRGTGNATPTVASPLVSAAVTAPDIEDVPDVSSTSNGAEANNEAAQPAVPKRSSRSSRRSRATASRRRNSSASETTTTSVSVSVAADAKTGHNEQLEAQEQDTSSDKTSTNNVEKKEEEEAEEAVGDAKKVSDVTAGGADREQPQVVEIPSVEVTTTTVETEASLPRPPQEDAPLPHPRRKDEEAPLPQPPRTDEDAPLPQSPRREENEAQPLPREEKVAYLPKILQKEKEEGELSDEPEDNSAPSRN